MTAIFTREGHLFRATEQAGGPWSPDMLQGSATTGLMVREVEQLAQASGFAVRRLTFDLWRPAGLRAYHVETAMLRDGRKAKTIQVRLLDGETAGFRLLPQGLNRSAPIACDLRSSRASHFEVVSRQTSTMLTSTSATPRSRRRARTLSNKFITSAM